MRILWYTSRRLLYVVPQVIGISLITFVIVRLLPSNPAYALAGPAATQESIDKIQHDLGLDQPIWTQYWAYLRHLAQGDFGNSFVSGRPVLNDIADRLPSTLELLVLGLFFAFLIGVPLGVLSALGGGRRIAGRLSLGYGLLAGAIPDFWLGLILVYFFYTKLNIAPPPLGQLSSNVVPPDHITGAAAFDSLITGNWTALRSAAGQLVLPLVTLVFVYMAPIVKYTRSSIEDVYYGAEFIEQYRANGLTNRAIVIRALRNGLPPVITIVGVLFGFLLGGLVLIETVFAWGGFGQYVVQAITNSDFSAVEGFVVVAAIFNLVVYLIVDLLYFVVDPRLRAGTR
jgi:ABC-type dipeptide/oligopeptide/nickel transport system permease component